MKVTYGPLLRYISRSYQCELSLYGRASENALRILFLKDFQLQYAMFLLWSISPLRFSFKENLYVWEKRRLASEALILQRSCFLFRFVGWSLLAFKLVVVFCRRESALLSWGHMCLLELRLLMESFKDWSSVLDVRGSDFIHPTNQQQITI